MRTSLRFLLPARPRLFPEVNELASPQFMAQRGVRHAPLPPPARGKACPRATTRGSTREAGRVGVPPLNKHRVPGEAGPPPAAFGAVLPLAGGGKDAPADDPCVSVRLSTHQ